MSFSIQWNAKEKVFDVARSKTLYSPSVKEALGMLVDRMFITLCEHLENPFTYDHMLKAFVDAQDHELCRVVAKRFQTASKQVRSIMFVRVERKDESCPVTKIEFVINKSNAGFALPDERLLRKPFDMCPELRYRCYTYDREHCDLKNARDDLRKTIDMLDLYDHATAKFFISANAWASRKSLSRRGMA